MSVEIEPTELSFTSRLLSHCAHEYSNRKPGPFTTEVSQSLKIKNTNRTPIAFKVCFFLLLSRIYMFANHALDPQVKTTAPKQYESSPTYASALFIDEVPDTVSARTQEESSQGRKSRLRVRVSTRNAL